MDARRQLNKHRLELAPIVFFIYNRPWHTEQSLNALAANDLAEQSILYVYADGPKPSASQHELYKIEATRQLIRQEKSFKEVVLVTSDYNKGINSMMVPAITEVVSKHLKVIVVEDDIVTGKGFLKYMNEALDLYKDDDEVAAINGYNDPIKFRNTADTFFLKGAQTWGWGTWKKGWDQFNPDVDFLLEELSRRDLNRSFNMDGAIDFVNILKLASEKKLQAWDVTFHASVFLNGKLTLNPKVSIVTNIGRDGSGTHGDKGTAVSFADYCEVYPIPVQESKSAIHDIRAFYIPSLKSRIVKRLKRIIHLNG